MLDDDLLTAIRRDVDAMARATPWVGDKSLGWYYARFLQPGLTARFVDTGRATALEVEVAALLALLRPAARDPYLWMVLEVIAKVHGAAAPAADLALAYAAGWGRGQRADDGRWDGPWSAAMQALVNTAARDIKARCMRMGLTVQARDVQDWAQSAVNDFLMRPRAGAPAYARFQSIHGWDPRKRRLRGWLRHALFGSGSTRAPVQANWFRNGLLYPLMESDGQLRVMEVAFRRCWNLTNPQDGTEPRRCRHESEYSHRQCEGCGEPFRVDSFEVFSKPRLVVPARYALKKFTSALHKLAWFDDRSCPCCGALAPSTWRCDCAADPERDWRSEPHCANCGRARPARPQRTLRWRCDCPRGAKGTGRASHDWHGERECPQCQAQRPDAPTWLCPHHGFEGTQRVCPNPACGQEGSRRNAHWAVRQDLGPSDRPGGPDDPNQPHDDPPHPPYFGDSQGLNSLENDALRQGLAELPEGEREIVARCAAGEVADMARELGVNPQEVRRRFRNAIRFLRKLPAFVAIWAGKRPRPEGGRP